MDLVIFGQAFITIAFFAIVLNVIMTGVFQLNAYVTLSEYAFFRRWMGKMVFIFAAGIALALVFQQDVFALAIPGHAPTKLGSILTGLLLGGGSRGIKLIIERTADVRNAIVNAKVGKTQNGN